MFNPEEIQNLRQLLCSNDAPNVELGLMILQQESQEVINTFKEELFLIRHFAHYLSTEDNGTHLAELCCSLIAPALKGKALHAFNDTFLKRDPTSESICNDIIKKIHGTCFNPQRFAQKLYDFYPKSGLVYLMQHTNDRIERDLMLNYLKGDALYLPEMPLRHFPKGIKHFDNIKSLVFQRMKLKGLPKEFGALKQLEILLMHNNRLETFPSVLYELPKLRILNVANNYLSEFPADIGKLDTLKMLDWSNNFGSLKGNESLGDLKQLKIFKWNVAGIYPSTKLVELPNVLTELPHLVTLELKGHDLSTLPDKMAQLQNLTYLELKGNTFQAFPSVLAWLPKLKTLSITLGSINELATFLPQIGSLSNLEELDLTNSYFSSFPIRLASLPKLKKLKIRRCGYLGKGGQWKGVMAKSLLKELLPNCQIDCEE